MVCFLESEDYEDTIRKAVALGGDSDTLACITGGIAEAYHEYILGWMADEAYERIPDAFREIITEAEKVSAYKCTIALVD